MENYVPVLTNKGHPLAPCHPRRAHGSVKASKARFQHHYGIRYTVLFKSRVPKLKNSAKVQLRFDPGPEHTGIAITRDHPDGSRSALVCIELQHRGKSIKSAMIQRSQRRRNRRSRLRFREPRFDNRTRSPEWLPPSLMSRLRNMRTWANRLSKLLPTTEVHVETAVFDPQLLRNPEIKGKQYQRGPLYQTNLRAAVFHRDQRQCVYCDQSGKRTKLELDHVVLKANGGTDRYDNLVVSCRNCNQNKANQSLDDFLKRQPKRLASIKAKLGAELAPATHLNVILPRLMQELRDDGWNVVEHDAATTAAGRKLCGIEKYHHGDAAVTSCPSRLRYMPDEPIKIQSTGRGAYQRIMPDAHGTPRGKGFRRYCKLPKHIRRPSLHRGTGNVKSASATLPPAITSPSSTRTAAHASTEAAQSAISKLLSLNPAGAALPLTPPPSLNATTATSSNTHDHQQHLSTDPSLHWCPLKTRMAESPCVVLWSCRKSALCYR